MSVAGRWKNQRESMMDLKIVSGTKLEGTYRTAVGGKYAQGQSWALSGVVEGDLLAFIVVFRDQTKDAESITAWSGRHFPEECDREGKVVKPERISTVWCLAHRWSSREKGDGSLEKTETEDWNHVLTNADVFTRRTA